jgi:hypothetical protein
MSSGNSAAQIPAVIGMVGIDRQKRECVRNVRALGLKQFPVRFPSMLFRTFRTLVSTAALCAFLTTNALAQTLSTAWHKHESTIDPIGVDQPMDVLTTRREYLRSCLLR